MSSRMVSRQRRILWMQFSVDSEKAHGWVTREELLYEGGLEETYARVVEDMHEKGAVGMIEIKAEAGLHQGSALSPFLFAAGSDRLADEARQESP